MKTRKEINGMSRRSKMMMNKTRKAILWNDSENGRRVKRRAEVRKKKR